MFTIKFETEEFAPGRLVTLRWAPHWEIDRGGVYAGGAWTFHLDEADFPDGLEFKFVLAPGHWMDGENLELDPDGMVGDVGFDASVVAFPEHEHSELVTENGVVAQRLLRRNMDTGRVYDVLVVGSGMGGGLLASQLADAGADVLVLEAGSYLFPTHVGNLPRRLRFGAAEKHVWSLWQDFRVVSHVNAQGAPDEFEGAQAFNLGGRSVFWGGLIPRQSEWELVEWPTTVRDHLLHGGYDDAEKALNRTPPDVTDYQETSKAALEAAFPGFAAEDAAMAVQYGGATRWSVPAGFFSTAGRLLEDVLVADPGPGRTRPTVNVNFAVWSVTTDPADPRRATGVRGWDLLAGKEREFRARHVVLAAGTVESAKIALNSALRDPNNRIGKGLTDHTIMFRHFTLPLDSPLVREDDSAKVILRHPAANRSRHGFHLVVELGAEFNQGLYANPENLAEERDKHGDSMLCELVVMFYADLVDANHLRARLPPANPVEVTMRRTPPSAADLEESEEIADAFFTAARATPLGGRDPALVTAGLEGVGHEVGTLRMADDGSGVVDENLKFLDYDNLYACDNSVFPASPAANPSLTLAALALRLAGRLRAQL